MDGIHVDSGGFPLIVVTFPERVIGDEELEAYLHQSAERLRTRTEPFAIVVDVGERSMLTPRQRKMQADFLNEHGAIMQRLCAGQAYVMSDRAMRGVLRAIFWLAPPPYPWKIFERRADAEIWARQQLAGGAASA